MKLLKVPVLYSSLTDDQVEENENMGYEVHKDEPYVDVAYIVAENIAEFYKSRTSDSVTVITLNSSDRLAVPIKIDEFLELLSNEYAETDCQGDEVGKE